MVGGTRVRCGDLGRIVKVVAVVTVETWLRSCVELWVDRRLLYLPGRAFLTEDLARGFCFFT